MASSLSFTRRIGRNALIKFTSEIIGRLASFVLVLVAARQLGTAEFGLYNYALAWGFVLAQLADLGLQLVITRELAAQPPLGNRQSAGTQPYSQSVLHPSAVQFALQLKLLLTIVVIMLMLLLTKGWALPERVGLLCVGLAPVLNTFVEFTGYVFRGRQDLQAEARLLTAARLTTAVSGILILTLRGSLLAFGLVNLLCAALFAIFASTLLRRHGWLGRPREVADYRILTRHWPIVRHLLHQALPLGIAIFLSIAYTRLAILLLQHFLGEVAVAQFSAATRLVEPAQIIPASLMAAVFPAFTLALGHRPQQARALGLRATLLLAFLGSGAAVTLWLLAPWLLPLLYGESYMDSVGVLRVLALAIPPTFINYSLTHYLIARGQQAVVGIFTAIMLLLHALICWWAIPRFGIIGPAYSIVAAEIFLFCATLFALINTKPRSLTVLPPTTSSTQSLFYSSTSTQP